MTNAEDTEDEDDIHLNVAEAGHQVRKLYCHLHRPRLTAPHLFMAGISFLNAIWHSPVVRRRLACEISSLFKSAYSVLTNLDKKILDDVVFTVLATTSVLGDLREMPPCRSLSGCF
ncbi:hypothetical protein I7I50_07599 [Histoplasma capsulatum G186AR]|uniref:Uncharacterized protein n=1 Tax=Ajellomyces capsulatus TaxID=5037 RepID=A0A8H8D2B8_AJECA|nr:hypothetical protein I7I52_09329 [Histoplasma capsulatum]QSS68249.1 hypothetical protein I7I50_07599 [Histoplasma capsulatum G186AR]